MLVSSRTRLCWDQLLPILSLCPTTVSLRSLCPLLPLYCLYVPLLFLYCLSVPLLSICPIQSLYCPSFSLSPTALLTLYGLSNDSLLSL